jgi:anti-anti-sigma factor
MKFEVKEVDNVKVIKLTGQVRISTQNEFKDLLDNVAKENEGKPVVISMDGVAYMNSAGLGIIIDTYKKFKEKQGRMILCNLTPDITKLFEVTRLDRFIEIYKTENEALASIA